MSAEQTNEGDDRVEALARQRLDAAESELRRKPTLSLGRTFGDFWRYPSPWMIAAYVVGACGARLYVGNWAASDAIAPLVFLALFPVLEWLIHVFILHWKPRQVAGVRVDSLLAREHRRHHADPRDVPLVFIPWRALIWVIAGGVAIPLGVGHLIGTSLGSQLSFISTLALVLFGYEWTHYVIHSDYKPKTRVYKAIWRNHRLHHYKNEHYWFSVTTSGTSDRVLGTYPDPRQVPTSATAKNLHALNDTGAGV